jgi:hypothetical protein
MHMETTPKATSCSKVRPIATASQPKDPGKAVVLGQGHLLHRIMPLVSAKEPTSQSEQDAVPGCEVTLPALHRKHCRLS